MYPSVSFIINVIKERGSTYIVNKHYDLYPIRLLMHRMHRIHKTSGFLFSINHLSLVQPVLIAKANIGNTFAVQFDKSYMDNGQ